MNTLIRTTLIGLLAVFASFAQLNTVLQTSLSAAITPTQTQFAIASATGVVAPSAVVAGSALYIVDIGQTKGELVNVQAITGTTVTVRRAQRASGHISGARVLVATAANWFYSVDPQGNCVTASTYANPYVNVVNGNQWKCSTQTLTWVPHWGNTAGSPQLLSGTATASVGGATAIAGPLVEISGTAAITSFTMSTGWNGQGFCVYPTGAFTTVAGNNIAEASTADADQILCFVYNARADTFSSSY